MDVTKLEVGDIIQISDYSYGCVTNIKGETFDEMVVTVLTVYIPSRKGNGEVAFTHKIEQPTLHSVLYNKAKIYKNTDNLPKNVKSILIGVRKKAISSSH